MATQPRGRVGRPARVSRDQVLGAAMALADRDGIEGLTMRGLGQRLGVEAMSLYRHVHDKDDVLDGIVDLVFGEIEIPSAGEEWRPAMRRRAISARAALVRHPWAVGLMESRARPGPANMRHHDAVLGSLRACGFSTVTAVRAYNMVDSYVYGFALQELSLPFRTPEEQSEVSELILRQFPAGEYPHLAAAAVELATSGFVYADEFELGLDLILDGIEKVLARN